MPRFHTRRHKTRGRKSKLTRTHRKRSQRGGDKKTVMKHLASFIADQEAGNVPGITYVPNDANIEADNNVLVIGPRYPKQTEKDIANCKYAYEECLFFFHISFPATYPSVSPTMKHLTSSLDARNPRLHPNLYERNAVPTYDGKVCLSILGTWAGPGWEPTMNLQSTLQTVQSILGPNALVNEPGHEGRADDDVLVISYNHAAFVASLRITLSAYKMVLEAPSEEAVPVDFVQPFYDVLRERAYTAVRFFLRKLAILKRKYPGGFQTVGELHHGAQKINYEALYDEVFALQTMITTAHPDLAKEVEAEDTSVRTEEDARRAEQVARSAARLIEMGAAAAGAPAPNSLNYWFSTLPKPLPAPNDFFWVGSASPNQLNYVAAHYNSKGNANKAGKFRTRAALKRKVGAVKYVDPETHKPIANANNNAENEYHYSNNDQ